MRRWMIFGSICNIAVWSKDSLVKHYLDFKTHAQIAVPKNYSPSWGRKTHRRGLIAVQALLDEEKAKV